MLKFGLTLRKTLFYIFNYLYASNHVFSTRLLYYFYISLNLIKVNLINDLINEKLCCVEYQS